MEGIGKFKVSDLVKETGVARTTINDWLQRYGQYLTYEIQGKRKLYTDHAVAVLREIAELRNAGQNSFEIESSLAARHPVRAEIAHEPHLDTLTDEDDEDEAEDENRRDEGLAAPDQEFAVIAKKQTDEIARLISEQLRMLNARLETIEASEKRARQANVYWAAAFLIAIVLFIAAGISVFRLYDARNRDVQQLQQQQNQTALALEKQQMEAQLKQKELQNLAVTLDRNSKDYEQNVRKLQSELAKQREDFEKNLKQLNEEVNVRDLRTRDAVAAEKLALLKQLYDTVVADSDKVAIIPSLQQNSRILDEMDKLRKQIESNRPVSTSNPAVSGNK